MALPTILNLSPLEGTEEASLGTSIQFDAYDPDGNIDVAETLVTVNGDVIWQADAPSFGYSGSRTVISNGWRYKITKLGGWGAGTYFGADILVKDTDLNEVTDSTWFVTVFERVVGRIWLRTIAQKLIRVTFNRDVVVEDALDSTKFTISLISDEGQEVRILGLQGNDPDGDGWTRYVDFRITKTTLGAVYKVTVSNLRTTDGKLIESAEGYLRGRKTKTDSILNKLATMYDSDVDDSTLAHVLIGLGISDDTIGAGEDDFDVVAIATGAIPSSTFGTATFGTNTFGG